MGNILKKIFSSFVALTTIAWSVGFGALAMPTAASAAVAGDLIKASGPAVYYFAADGKRYVFPNEKTYFSWFMDFSSVRTISDTELASILIGGNVTIRPGTKLVKIQTDPKVYAVTLGGMLHWVESEALATTLYGSAWATRVVDVPDSFFVNYTIGSSVSTPVHPDGSVVSYSGDSMRYVVWGGMKRKIVSDSVFAANGFNPAYTLMTTIAYSNGTDITSRECPLADVIAICGTTPVVTGGVTVSLASDTPAAQTVPKNAASVMLAKYNFTAGSAEALIDGLQIRRIGVGAASDLANVYLYDGNGNRMTTGRTINSTTNVTEFNGLNFSVPAGQTKSIVIVGDFSSPATAGGQHSFEITNGGSVVIVGSGTVGGNFPVRGNVFTVGTTSAGRLDVQKGTTPANPNIGAQNAEISNFKLTANTNDIEVRRVTLIQTGGISNSDLTNFNLYQGSTLVASTAAMVGDKIVLTFNPPYVITNGTTKTFALQAKVAGRAGRDIKTYVEYTTDVYAIDRLYNSGAAICIADTAVGGCTSAGQGSFDGDANGAGTADDNAILVTTQGGQLTVSFNGPVTGNVAKGNQDVVLYRFSLTSPDNQLEIRNVDFHIQGNTASDLVKGSSGTEYFRDIKIKDLDTGLTWMGPTNLPSGCTGSGSSTACLITLSDARNINAGQTLNLAITADLYNGTDDISGEFSADGNNQYRVVHGDNSSVLFGSSDVRVVTTGEFLATDKIVPNTAISGNLQTVKASNLSIALAASPSAGTAVKKQEMIPTAGFVFTAGDQSDISIKTVKLTGAGSFDGSFYAATTVKDIVTACALFDGDTQVGLSQAPDTTAGTFNITNMNVTVPRGGSKTLVAKCTADSQVEGVADYIALGIDLDADVTAEDQEANTVVPSRSTQVDANVNGTVLVQTIRNSGTLTIATDNLRQSTILVGDNGAVWQNFAQFKATAQYEDVNLDKVTVTSTGVAANFLEVAVAQDGAVKGQGTLPSGSYSFKDIDLSGSPVIVPKDGSATFQIWGKLADVVASGTVSGSTNAARSGNLMQLGVAGDIQTGDWDTNYDNQLNIRANGSASGDRLYATTTAGSTNGSVGNQFVLRKTKPVVTRQALSSTTLTSGLDTDLYKFQVAADSAGSVGLKKVVFNWSKGDSNSSFNFQNLRLRKGSSDVADGDIDITSATGVNFYTSGPAVGETSGQIVIVFTNEETISGSGSVYTLHGTINGTVDSGDSLSLNFRRNSGAVVTTGYLTDAVFGGIRGPNINTSSSPDVSPDAEGTFVWSDNSEVPHSYASGTAGGSRDWTNDTYVEDLTQQSTLSR
ncbi:hypothetical protein M0Q28_02690 [Patescibacteria group bacterium]|jgi:hypothetical protein|nr:hypothetical protein [Patescibacteria group bacterium]